MALDRQSIEKKDFPIGRRGYEPEAVDAHLARLADEIESLRRSQGRRGGASESLAAVASAQVQAIVEAAETSAEDIERAAQEEAARIRGDAVADAESTRAQAIGQSQEHVGKVHQATAQMLQRVEAMEGELGALVESLRTGANRLNADLSLLEGGMTELYDAAGGPPAAAPPLTEAPQGGAGPVELEDDVAAPPAEAPAPARGAVAATEAEPAPAPEEIRASRSAPAVADDEDVEGARLIALNMALNGQTRDETDRYLAENFVLGDRQGLLDEVYSSVEG